MFLHCILQRFFFFFFISIKGPTLSKIQSNSFETNNVSLSSLDFRYWFQLFRKCVRKYADLEPCNLSCHFSIPGERVTFFLFPSQQTGKETSSFSWRLKVHIKRGGCKLRAKHSVARVFGFSENFNIVKMQKEKHRHTNADTRMHARTHAHVFPQLCALTKN